MKCAAGERKEMQEKLPVSFVSGSALYFSSRSSFRELPHDHLLSTGARTKDVAFTTSYTLGTLGTLALRIVDWQGAE